MLLTSHPLILMYKISSETAILWSIFSIVLRFSCHQIGSNKFIEMQVWTFRTSTFSIEYSTWRKREALPFGTTWTHLEDTLLSEISQAWQDKYCMFPFLWGIGRHPVPKSRQQHGCQGWAGEQENGRAAAPWVRSVRQARWEAPRGLLHSDVHKMNKTALCT